MESYCQFCGRRMNAVERMLGTKCGACVRKIHQAVVSSGTLSPVDIKLYVEDNGLRCPYCGSAHIRQHQADIGDGKMFQEITCSACGRQWLDVYKLISIDAQPPDTI